MVILKIIPERLEVLILKGLAMTEVKQGEGKFPAKQDTPQTVEAPKGSPPIEAGSVLDKNSTKVGMGVPETTENFGEPRWAS